jgi:hypothetical protein
MSSLRSPNQGSSLPKELGKWQKNTKKVVTQSPKIMQFSGTDTASIADTLGSISDIPGITDATNYYEDHPRHGNRQENSRKMENMYIFTTVAVAW